MADLSQLLWATYGITAKGRKEKILHGAVPSAEGTYPLLLYVVMEEGLYLYVAGQNFLELVWHGDLRSKLGYEGLYNPNRRAIRVASHTVVIAMNTPLAMEISPLTEDNLKFVYFEAGHAAQNFILQSVDLGLGTTTITSFDLKRVYRFLRLSLEHRLIYIMPVGHPRE